MLVLIRICSVPRQGRTAWLPLGEARQTGNVGRLDRKAGPTATTAGGHGVFDFERGTAQIIDEIDDATAQQIDADAVHHQFHAVCFRDNVIGVDAFGQAEAIGKARTAAAINRQTQRSVRITLALGNPTHTRSSSGRQGDGRFQFGSGFRHAPKIGYRGQIKRAEK